MVTLPHLVYDNCKDCHSNCEHAGKDREFVCRNGISCKKLYSQNELEKAAHDTVIAIKILASKPENLENLENYLSHNFPEWMKKYANKPENLAAELKEFANMTF